MMKKNNKGGCNHGEEGSPAKEKSHLEYRGYTQSQPVDVPSRALC